MNRTRLARGVLICVAVLAVLLSGHGLGTALAEPTTDTPTTSTEEPASDDSSSDSSSDDSSGESSDESGESGDSGGKKELPKGFPKDLRKLVGGTEEFKTASWFTGACSSKGGDVAGYIGQALTHEPELMFWRMPEEDRWKVLEWQIKSQVGGLTAPSLDGVGPATKENLKKAVESGTFRPTGAMLPDAYPTGRSSEWPSTSPVCADDIKKWATPSMTTWGFKWASRPDDGSVTAMKAAAGEHAEEVGKRIDSPCEGDKNSFRFCEHAYFLNCDKETLRDQKMVCQQWNTNIGRMFAGTVNWIDQNRDVGDRLNDAVEGVWKMSPAYQFGQGVAKAYSFLWDNTIGPLVEFAKDAKELPEKWANYFKSSAMDMLDKVLPGLASVGEFDLTQSWFLKWYAMSVGLGITVMIAMFLLATASAARKGGADTLARDIVGYLPLGLVLMIYTPMLVGMLQAMMHALTTQIIELGGTTTDELVENVSSTLGALTDKTLVGGVIAGIIGFGFMVFGLFAVYLGMLMHQIGIPLACVGAAIAYGMLVFPKMRPKALKIPLMLISLMASVPILFLMLIVVFEVISSALNDSTTGEGDLASLGQLMLAAFGFFTIGVAPFALLKWAPMLPSEEDADRMGDSGGGSGQVVGGMGMGGGGVQRRMNSNATSSHTSGAGSAPAGGGGSDAGGGGGSGGGKHAAPSGGLAKSGAGNLGKLAAIGGGPVGGTAARLTKVAGSAAAHSAGGAVKAGAGAGVRAGAMNAANRAHGVAADSAPTSPN
ncbi:hypothetical protein [Gordonia humi]|uniref:TrbL/VirB6 plasmid conjugal transfer protein n=1 Tax=Gordonia humi TaxID=686429 RepID=A0A840F2F4_9ACTN|nr:hypothetical protein [Gordonia humi]MBB4138081.1 hypothetical protein [Gordonia humi]